MDTLISTILFVATVFQISYLLGTISLFNFFHKSYDEGDLQKYCKHLAHTNFLSVYLNFSLYKERSSYSLVSRLTGINSFSIIFRSAVLISICLICTLLLVLFTESISDSVVYMVSLSILSILSAIYSTKELLLVNALKQDYMVPFHTYRHMAAPSVSTLNYSLFSTIDYDKMEEEVFTRENRELLEVCDQIHRNEDENVSTIIVRKTVYTNTISISVLIDNSFVTFYHELNRHFDIQFGVSRDKNVEDENTILWWFDNCLTGMKDDKCTYYISKNDPQGIYHYDDFYEGIIAKIADYSGNEERFIIIAPTVEFKEFINEL